MHELADQLGLYKDNTIDEQVSRLQPGLQAISVLVMVSLLVAIGFSVVQVVFRYFNYKVLLQQNAYQMEWGLFTRHHKTMPFSKVEYLTWSATWLRSKMNLFILRLHSLSDPLAAQELQLQVPATHTQKLKQLIEPYHTIPHTREPLAIVGIQQAYWWRRVLLFGIPLTAAALLALWWGNALWWWWLPLGWLVYFTIAQIVFVKKYAVRLFDDAVWISTGIWGQKHLYVKYQRILHVSVRTSPWQRSHGYANLCLHLPAQVWKIPFLKVDEARQLADYFIFELEKSDS
jgi:putative membrane protein